VSGHAASIDERDLANIEIGWVMGGAPPVMDAENSTPSPLLSVPERKTSGDRGWADHVIRK
jgi:hypothetical protein